MKSKRKTLDKLKIQSMGMLDSQIIHMEMKSFRTIHKVRRR